MEFISTPYSGVARKGFEALVAALSLWIVALEAATPLDPFWLDPTEKLEVSAIQFRTLVIITRDPPRINWGFV